MTKKEEYENIIPGFYLGADRCFFVSGSTKGNKWVYLTSHKPKWNGLMWWCLLDDYDNGVKGMSYHVSNPTKYTL